MTNNRSRCLAPALFLWMLALGFPYATGAYGALFDLRGVSTAGPDGNRDAHLVGVELWHQDLLQGKGHSEDVRRLMTEDALHVASPMTAASISSANVAFITLPVRKADHRAADLIPIAATPETDEPYSEVWAIFLVGAAFVWFRLRKKTRHDAIRIQPR